MYTHISSLTRTGLLSLFCAGFSVTAAHSAIVLEHYYGFESGALGSDSEGTQDFTTTSSLSSQSGGVYGGYATVAGINGQAAGGADWSSSLGTGSWAIGMYVRASGTATSQSLLQTGASGDYFGFYTGPSNNGATNGSAWGATINTKFWIADFNANNESLTPGGDNTPILIDDNQWQQLVVIRDATNGTYKYYIDGSLIGSTSSGINTVFSNTQIGAGTGTNPFDIDDLRVYSWDATSDSEANVLSAFSTAVPEPSSTALIGLGALGFLLRRRRG